MTNKVYIYCPYNTAHGVTVIVENLIKYFAQNGFDCEWLSSLDSVPINSMVIPYALDPSIELLEKGYKPRFSYLVDACSLGYLNKIKFYLRHFNFFHYDFFYCLYWYFADYRLEKKVVRQYENVILVSETDIEYLKKKYKATANFICLPNGVDRPILAQRSSSKKLRLGILSSWGHPTTAGENKWFIIDYFGKYVRTHNDVELILAGRGEYIRMYEGLTNVKIMGAVEDLNEFFSNIDIMVSANPKGCGILNRVLDAFAHKTCVLGNAASFTGFRYMKDAYVEFGNYIDFEEKLNYLVKHSEIREKLVENAYQQICDYNDWDTNITGFITKYVK